MSAKDEQQMIRRGCLASSLTSPADGPAPLSHGSLCIQSTRITFLRLAVGGVLLTAATFKIWEPFSGNRPPVQLSNWFYVAHIQWEIFLGTWLISGVYAKGAWGSALACFFVYGVFAGYKFLAGESTCGCMGQVALSPLAILAFDVGALILLFWQRKRFIVSSKRESYRLEVLGVCALIAVCGGIIAVKGLYVWDQQVNRIFGTASEG
ncbi:MAG: MauE/DoxX family redox-associated membrane protein, partial [Ktedonobacteraceae bacterium]